ncbi:MAG: imidazoleglycerol-phosphate dehydratase [Syntrophales bacterium]|nr:imidazoleglycerol-phosphate dehydratase [Syntrophales bacterium]
MERKGEIYRKTSETEINLSINLDGSGTADLASSVPFLDHMLNLFARHAGLDLFVRSQGDTQIDDHHLVEDLGICLGDAVKKALGDKGGIKRYGSIDLPMDETLCNVAMDISGRPYLVCLQRGRGAAKQFVRCSLHQGEPGLSLENGRKDEIKP